MWLQFIVLPLIVSVASAAVGNAVPAVQCSNDRNILLATFGHKEYYLETFVKLNWYRAAQFCRYHGMDLASISSEEENVKLLDLLNKHGFNGSTERLWTSGTDLGNEGSFFWMSNGQPLLFQNWVPHQPDNSGGAENCLQLWNYENQGYKWNDIPCSHELYFICETF